MHKLCCNLDIMQTLFFSFDILVNKKSALFEMKHWYYYFSIMSK